MDMVNSLSVSNTTILAVTSRSQERSAIAGPQQVGTSAGYTGLSYNRKGPRTPIVDPFLVCLNHVKDTPKKKTKKTVVLSCFIISLYIPISSLYRSSFTRMISRMISTADRTGPGSRWVVPCGQCFLAQKP